MQAIDIIIVAIVTGLVITAIVTIIKRKRRGGSGCGCGCGGCASSEECHKK